MTNSTSNETITRGCSDCGQNSVLRRDLPAPTECLHCGCEDIYEVCSSRWITLECSNIWISNLESALAPIRLTDLEIERDEDGIFTVQVSTSKTPEQLQQYMDEHWLRLEGVFVYDH